MLAKKLNSPPPPPSTHTVHAGADPRPRAGRDDRDRVGAQLGVISGEAGDGGGV